MVPRFSKRCQLVRKEIWTHLLGYNLVRTITAQAAIKHGLGPRSLSFKGAIQTLEAFQPMVAFKATMILRSAYASISNYSMPLQCTV